MVSPDGTCKGCAHLSRSDAKMPRPLTDEEEREYLATLSKWKRFWARDRYGIWRDMPARRWFCYGDPPQPRGRRPELLDLTWDAYDFDVYPRCCSKWESEADKETKDA